MSRQGKADGPVTTKMREPEECGQSGAENVASLCRVASVRNFDSPKTLASFGQAGNMRYPTREMSGPKSPMTCPETGCRAPHRATAKIHPDDARPMPIRLPLPQDSPNTRFLITAAPRPKFGECPLFNPSFGQNMVAYSGSSSFIKHDPFLARTLCFCDLSANSTAYCFFFVATA